jgi:O-antigen/teichoic acid export membrane protein
MSTRASDAGAVPVVEVRPKPEVRIGGDAFSVFGATVVALGIGFLTSIVVARLLGPDGRGLLGVAYSLATIGVAIVSLGVPVAISYYGSRRARLLPRLVGSALAYCAVMLVVLVLLALVVSGSGLDWLGEGGDLGFWLLTGLLTWAVLMEYVGQNTLRARFLYGSTNALLVLSRITILVATVVLVAALGLGTQGALVALIAGSGVYAVGALRPFVQQGLRLSRHVFAAMVHFGWRVQIGRLIQMGNGRLDVLILSAFASLSTVGVYVVAQVVAELVMLVPTAIGFVAMPAIAQGRASGPDAGRTVRLSGTLSLVGVGVVALGAPVLIFVGYGSDFAPALLPLYILLPGTWLFGAGNVMGDVFRGRGRPGLPSVLAGIAIVVTVVLDLLLIPPFGAVGAAVASTCAYTVFGVSSAMCLGRLEGLSPRRLLLADSEEMRDVTRTLGRRLGHRRTSRAAGRG